MPESSSPSGFAYRAFLSYSHADSAWCDWLHKALETWHVPSRLVGKQTAHGIIPRKLAPIFRDRDELPSAHDLNNKVAAALAQSESLIVICSPASAASRWVNEEVLAYKRLGRAERIFCLIVDGEPNASELAGREAEECFCPALRFQMDDNGQPTHERTEPIAADARAGKDGKSNGKLKLIAGMLDVGFDALKQRELQRRNRRMTAIAAMAMIVMLVTSVLAVYALISRHDAVIAQRQAVVAQQAAERRQKQAEGLVGFMLGDLNDKLSQVNRLDILEAVDDKAMAYFQSLPGSDVTTEALVQRAKALERIGSVRLDQGHLPAALDSYQAALKLISAQAQASPKDMEIQLAYAENVSFIGTTHWYQGNLEAAERDFESSESILSRAQAIHAADPELLFQKQIIENNLGHILESRGNFSGALVAYQRALALAKELVAIKPDNTEWVQNLGGAHNNLGKLALTRGDLATAIAEYAADDRIETALSARDPRNNDQRQNVFRVRAILGRTLALAGQTSNAIQDFRAAIAIAEQLNQQSPPVASVRENSALYKMQLSRLLRLTGSLSGATKLTDDSLATFATLTHQDPSNSSLQREFAEALTEQAAQSLAADKPVAAFAQVRSALSILDPALAKQSEDRAVLLATMGARLLLASMASSADAQRLREGCLAAIAGVKSGAGDPRLLALRVSALLGLGRQAEAQPVLATLQQSGYFDPALVQELKEAHITYSPNALIRQRPRTGISGDERKDASRN